MARKNKIGLDYFSHDVEMFNDIKINDIEIHYNNFTDLTLDDLASIVVKFSYSPKAANKILEIKINTTI